MTRTEFNNNITSFYELIDFCSDEGCDICSDIVCGDVIDEIVDENLEDFARNTSWRAVRDVLNEVPDDDDYYRYEGSLEFIYIDDCFSDYKEEVYNWADRNDVFDEEDDEEECDEGRTEEEKEDDTFEFEVNEEVSAVELFASCYQSLDELNNNKIAKEIEDDEALLSLINSDVQRI